MGSTADLSRQKTESENRTIKIIKSEKQRGKRMKKMNRI